MSPPVIRIPKGYFPPPGYEIFGRHCNDHIAHEIERTRDRKRITLIWDNNASVPEDFPALFRQACQEKEEL